MLYTTLISTKANDSLKYMSERTNLKESPFEDFLLQSTLQQRGCFKDAIFQPAACLFQVVSPTFLFLQWTPFQMVGWSTWQKCNTPTSKLDAETTWGVRPWATFCSNLCSDGLGCTLGKMFRSWNRWKWLKFMKLINGVVVMFRGLNAITFILRVDLQWKKVNTGVIWVDISGHLASTHLLVKFLSTRHVTVLFLVTFAETKTKTPSGRIRKWCQVGEFYHLQQIVLEMFTALCTSCCIMIV